MSSLLATPTKTALADGASPDKGLIVSKESTVLRFVLLLSVFHVLGFTQAMSSPSPAILPLQAVVVLTESWSSVDASIQLFERTSADSPWMAVNKGSAAVVGRNGLGWGMGIHDDSSLDSAPIKHEGDGKAPAGVYLLKSAFGYASPESAQWIRLPYQQATTSLRCVDDVDSEFYNRILDISHIPLQWKSHEEMLRKDDLYKLGIVVSHNDHPPIPGRGSCIFMHIWKAPSQGTSGCTAMAESDLREVLRWLDPAKTPVLVQLPRSEYERYRTVWSLPRILDAAEEPHQAGT